MSTSAQLLEPFIKQQTVLLTTYRRNGTAVGTPVHIAVEGERAFFRSWHTAGKTKRIRHTPAIEIAPSTASGKPTGPAIQARARLLSGEESAQAARAIARKYPIIHGYLIPLLHRLRGLQTVQFEVTPVTQ